MILMFSKMMTIMWMKLKNIINERNNVQLIVLVWSQGKKYTGVLNVNEDAEDNGSVTEVVSHSSKNGLSYCKDNDEHDKKKWRTGKSYFNTEEQMKEFKAPSTQLSTQELLLNVPPRPTTRRAMAAR